ncbi:hypothetical protein L6255_02280 [Candidatus Parcubacteria bacterium]|nr:hypothetical protein [Patescibacteria group bacterium]MCG2689244.1 hypothetical protein [Candidatus Parcubacteria bacterium]
MEILNLPLTIKVFKEGSSKESPYVAYNPVDGAKEDGTLDQLLEESVFAVNTTKSIPSTVV